MNMQTRIDLADRNIATADVNLTAIMEREGIRRIERRGIGLYLVELSDNRCGCAVTVGQALAKAKKPDAVRLA